jgi:amidase
MAARLWQSGPMINALCGMSALELAGMIAAREVSSVEVVNAHLDRIEDVNPRVNAIVRRLDVTARQAAEAADRAVAAGSPLGVFHGVPMTVKENIDVAGTPTTNAVTALAEFIVTTDAPVVERMRSAGAIPIGRTNLPDFGLRVATESSLHGITRNPWNPDLTAGGSSGGEAVALATAMSPIGLGNDLGGSLRNPAHCCGIASIKPSTGLVPSASELPPEDSSIMMQLMSVEGVMARRVADVRAGLLAIAGPHLRDPKALPIRLIEAVSGRPLRVALLAEPPGGDTDPGIAASIRAAADALANAGAEVVEACPATYARAIELWSSLLITDIRELMPMLELVLGADARTFLGFAEQVNPESTIATFSAGLIERSAVERDFHRFLHAHDVLLSPTWAMRAFPHGADVASLEGGLHTLSTMRPVLPANLLGLPAAVVPVGLADGMPVGAQVTARRCGDLVALQVAEMLEDVFGLMTPIEPI